MRVWTLFLLCAIGQLAVGADDSARTVALMARAKEIIAGMENGDVAKVIDATYPPVVESMGGRKKAIKVTEQMMTKMKSVISDMKYTVGSPGPFQIIEMETFVVVPTTMEMTFKEKGTVRGKSYLLGISSDSGKTWTFVDGSGLRTPKGLRQTLPKVHEKLKLPEPEQPEIIRNAP